MIQTEKSEKILKLANDIMKLSRNTLIVNMRFIDTAVSRLETAPYEGSVACNGEYIFFDPKFILKRYKECREIPVRYYFHMLLHSVFRHNIVSTLFDRDAWDIACDIAVENIINELDLPSMTIKAAEQQRNITDNLKKNVKYLTAEKIYAYLTSGTADGRNILNQRAVFHADDHSVWYKPQKEQNNDSSGNEQGKDSGGGKSSDNNSNDNSDDNSNDNNKNSENTNISFSARAALEEDWKNIAEKMQTDLETFSKKYGDKSGDLIQNLNAVNREKYDYSDFLRKFAVMGEAMKINDDEYDYIFYTYGMKLYKNMPLIEPLEYKEVKRIKEFVIAIDTSGSVEGELVQTFLQKTYNILKQSESFFTKINLHIIQCDAEIKEDVKITSAEEFDEYIRSMKLHGFGGTDFRPVFSYVDELIGKGEFSNLKGLIYFTDGYGEFPAHQPDYNTAFVFIDDEYNNPDVPVWAIKLVLQKNEV